MTDLAGDDRLYRLFFESSSDAFYVMPTNVDGIAQRFIEVNQRACDMLGYSKDELLGMTYRDIDKSISPEAWKQGRTRLWKKRNVHHYRTHTRRDGTTFPVEISMQICEARDRSFVLVVARDISERVAAEERLKDSQQDLQALVDTGLGFSALVSPDTTILRINEVGAGRLGSTPEGLKGKRIIDLSPRETIDGRKKIGEEVVRHRRRVTFTDARDGMWLEHTVSPIVDDAGDVSRFAIFSRDVTVNHLTREVDSLFNNIDRSVLDGTPVRTLIQFACGSLAEAFNSPLVSFEESGTNSHPLQFCQGAWCEEAGAFPRLHPDLLQSESANADVSLSVIKPQDHPGLALFPDTARAQPAAVALLVFRLPTGTNAILTIASGFDSSFDHEPVPALLRQAARRFQLAFELAANQRELGLVQQALERAHSAVIITDADGQIVWTNDAFTRHSGFARGEVGKVQQLTGPADHQADRGPDTPKAPDPFQEVLDTGKVWSGEAETLRRDGSTYTVLQSITPVFSENGPGAKPSIRNLIAIQDDISSRKLDEARIRYLAEHDALTGLYNRGYLLDFLHELLVVDRRGRHRNIAFLYLDIDHFKQFNDRYGHQVGDELLAGFAQRLQQVVRQGDLACRIGGDEFVLVLMDIRSPAEAKGVATKLLADMAAPIECGSLALMASTSIGISLAPGDGETTAVLLQKADTAMYEAKRLGRARACVFGDLQSAQPMGGKDNATDE